MSNEIFNSPISLFNLSRYLYGQKPIVYDAADGVGYESGGKSLKCIGFTHESLVRDEYLCGTGMWAVIAQKDSPVSERMLAALVQAMRTAQLALIVRYVYNAKSRPKMMALFPNDTLKHSPAHHSLLMHELIYKDHLVEMMLPHLRTTKTEPSAEQFEAVDRLIDAMDLTAVADKDIDTGEPVVSEAFRNLLNPVLQHTYRRIAQRALHPKEPLIAPDDDLMAMLNVPRPVKDHAQPQIMKIKDLFKLETVQRDTVSRKYKTFSKINALASDGGAIDGAAAATDPPDNNNEVLVEIGTVTPAEDFDELLRRGERISRIAEQMQKVIQDLVFKSVIVAEEKVLRAIIMYREQAKLHCPFRYNEWISDFKKSLLQRRKMDAWQTLIVAERAGLITTAESEISTVTDAEAETFYATSGTGTNDNNDQLAEAEDDDDLFDDMWMTFRWWLVITPDLRQKYRMWSRWMYTDMMFSLPFVFLLVWLLPPLLFNYIRILTHGLYISGASFPL